MTIKHIYSIQRVIPYHIYEHKRTKLPHLLLEDPKGLSALFYRKKLCMFWGNLKVWLCRVEVNSHLQIQENLIKCAIPLLIMEKFETKPEFIITGDI